MLQTELDQVIEEESKDRQEVCLNMDLFTHSVDDIFFVCMKLSECCWKGAILSRDLDELMASA